MPQQIFNLGIDPFQGGTGTWEDSLLIDSDLVENNATAYLRWIRHSAGNIQIRLSSSPDESPSISGPKFTDAVENYEEAFTFNLSTGGSYTLDGPEGHVGESPNASEPYFWIPDDPDGFREFIFSIPRDAEVTFTIDDGLVLDVFLEVDLLSNAASISISVDKESLFVPIELELNASQASLSLSLNKLETFVLIEASFIAEVPIISTLLDKESLFVPTDSTFTAEIASLSIFIIKEDFFVVSITSFLNTLPPSLSISLDKESLFIPIRTSSVFIQSSLSVRLQKFFLPPFQFIESFFESSIASINVLLEITDEILLPFLTKISSESDKKINFNEISVAMGEGYSQSAPRGLHPITDIWKIKWVGLTDTEKNELIKILDEVGISDILLWTPNYETQEKKFNLENKGYKLIRVGKDKLFNVDCSLKETFQ